MNKYKYFFYHNLDLACFANLEGYFEELNESFTKVLGYTSEELIGRKFFEFIHPDDVASTVKEVEKLSSGLTTINFINRYRTKSDEYKYLDWSSQLDLETKKIHATARDITEKMIAGKELLFQNEEKEKRASELVIANTELAYQNKEKGKRAAELVTVNKELLHQNEEKKKRSTELVIANEELTFQNHEKERRASELIISNKELKKSENDCHQLNEKLKIQNEKLFEIAYMLSQRIETPATYIFGLFNLFNFGNSSDPINGKIFRKLKTAIESFNKIIREIMLKTDEVKNIVKQNFVSKSIQSHYEMLETTFGKDD